MLVLEWKNKYGQNVEWKQDELLELQSKLALTRENQNDENINNITTFEKVHTDEDILYYMQYSE